MAGDDPAVASGGLGETLVEEFLSNRLGELLQLLDGYSDILCDFPELVRVVGREPNALLPCDVFHHFDCDFTLAFGIHRILLSNVQICHETFVARIPKLVLRTT